MTGVDWGRASHYIGCALGVALASTGVGLTMAIFYCVSLMITEP